MSHVNLPRIWHARVDRVIETYARGADTACNLGFDGIEIHGGYGCLINQFLGGEMNKRSDSYGGSPRARGRFAGEIIAECRQRLRPGMPVVMHISQWKKIGIGREFCHADPP
jgi:2,4-dienoyl-CoA reductase-like NADH-dependent reductase (Old Yellow Enzyme family)